MLRLCTSVLLPIVAFNAPISALWLDVAVTLLVVSLAAGLAVRLAAFLSALVIVLAATRSGGALTAILGVQALQTATLTLLGAGAYSIDARLFGRRVIQLND